jgi:hypothetical protein
MKNECSEGINECLLEGEILLINIFKYSLTFGHIGKRRDDEYVILRSFINILK